MMDDFLKKTVKFGEGLKSKKKKKHKPVYNVSKSHSFSREEKIANSKMEALFGR